jgi:adenosine deaminase
MRTQNQLKALPKIELHLHLDCCLSFSAVSQLRPGISEATYRKEFMGPRKCIDLADFLKVIDNSLELLQTKEGLQIAVQDLFLQLKEDNVIYVEIRFAPLLHLQKGLSPNQVVAIVAEEVTKEILSTGIEARIILCTLRHFTEKQALITAQLIETCKDNKVVALDLAADEAGFPIDAQIAAFQFARDRHFFCTAHAGEAKGPQSVRETLTHLMPSRIGHGVRSFEDPELLEELKSKKILLEVCPTCNIQIDIFDTFADHPVDKLFQAGVAISINTDTRTITNTTLTDEYRHLQEVFGWTVDHFNQCNRNALQAAFLPEETKTKLLQQLNLS